MTVSTVSQFHQFDEAKWNFASKKAYQGSEIHKVKVDSNAIYNGQISSNSLPKNDDFSFLDFVDIINPLQHIPLVNTLYQNITGDTMQGFSRVMGGALYGGPIGTASAVTNEILEDTSGKDISGHMLAMLSPEENDLINQQIAKPGDMPLVIEVRGRNYIDDLGQIVTSDDPADTMSPSSEKQSLLQDEMKLGLIYLQEEIQLEARPKQISPYTNMG